MDRKVSFTLNNKEYSVSKPGLRKWVELEEANKKILAYMKGKDTIGVENSICSYLSIVIDIDKEEITSCYWLEVAEAYIDILNLCLPTISFPILRTRTEEQKEVWDYENRTWYIWSHLLASKYGWTIEYIAEIDFEDAIALLQEILIETQNEKEWEWSLSEIAYPYDSATKKHIFKPLPKPDWMKNLNVRVRPVEKVKMPSHMLPMGIILTWEIDTHEETIH